MNTNIWRDFQVCISVSLKAEVLLEKGEALKAEVLLENGRGFQIVSSEFRQKKMFSLLLGYVFFFFLSGKYSRLLYQ